MNDQNHAQLKRELEAELRRALGVERLTPAMEAFVAQAGEDVAAGELPDLSAADLAANLADFWRFADKRRGLAPAVRGVRATPAEGGAAG